MFLLYAESILVFGHPAVTFSMTNGRSPLADQERVLSKAGLWLPKRSTFARSAIGAHGRFPSWLTIAGDSLTSLAVMQRLGCAVSRAVGESMSNSRKPPAQAGCASEKPQRSFTPFYWFTILIWVGAAIGGAVIGARSGTGTGFGDTRLQPLTAKAPVYGSILGDGWRLGVTFVALALLPVFWYVFLRALGAFASHDELPPATELQQRDSLVRSERDNALATAVAYRVSVLSLLVLLVFGNFFLPYVVLRWGWGGV